MLYKPPNSIVLWGDGHVNWVEWCGHLVVLLFEVGTDNYMLTLDHDKKLNIGHFFNILNLKHGIAGRWNFTCSLVSLESTFIQSLLHSVWYAQIAEHTTMVWLKSFSTIFFYFFWICSWPLHSVEVTLIRVTSEAKSVNKAMEKQIKGLFVITLVVQNREVT